MHALLRGLLPRSVLLRNLSGSVLLRGGLRLMRGVLLRIALLLRVLHRGVLLRGLGATVDLVSSHHLHGPRGLVLRVQSWHSLVLGHRPWVRVPVGHPKRRLRNRLRCCLLLQDLVLHFS